MSEIRVLLGGRAAEQVVFNDITTGASNDIQRATAIAHAMVTKFGMSEKFGPILLDSTAEGDMFAQKHYSDVTGKEIDDEIRKIINDAYNDMIKLLTDNYEMLDHISKTLLVRETITGDELKLLLEGKSLDGEDGVIEDPVIADKEPEEILDIPDEKPKDIAPE